MHKNFIVFGACAIALASCATQLDGPIGAPQPTHPEMTFVDGQGCYWWVIGNATSYSWAKTTNGKGEHVCTETDAKSAQTNPGVPFITSQNADTPTTAPAPQPAGRRFVQVATFAQSDNAQASVNRFEKLGLPVRPSSKTIGSDGFYRLVLGPFDNNQSAASALDTAQNEGFFDAFSYRR